METHKGDCKLANKDVNNADFFYENSVFVRSQGYTQCVLVRNTEYELKFSLFTGKKQLKLLLTLPYCSDLKYTLQCVGTL